MTDDAPRASVQDLLGGAGAPPVVSYGGREYPLVPDQAAAARYERLVAQWATDAVLALKGVVPDDVYAGMLDGLTADLRGRQHGRGGRLWRQAMESADADALFLAALMGTDAGTAAECLEADPDRVRLALTEAVPDFLARLLRGLTAARPEEIRAAAAARLAGRGSSAG
jgi:hypothetical protein